MLQHREKQKQQLSVIDTQEKKSAQQLAILGHEVKSPLARILVLAEFLYNEVPGELNKEQKEYLQDIYNNSCLLMNSVNTLLSMNKGEYGCLYLNASPNDLKEVVEGVVAKVDSIAASKDCEIVLDIPDKIPVVNIDRDKIEQVMFNLLDNAIKFTDKGTITVRVEDDKEEGNLIVSVSDTGVGIKGKNKERVFDKFFTEKNALNPRGSGLGLAVVKEFVKLHRGEVWLRSSPGSGTCVYFSIDKGLGIEKGECSSYAGGCK